jgi:alpha-tubulin suppressor-like RCC1 family protein
MRRCHAPVEVDGSSDVVVIAGGCYYTVALALKKDGTVWAWGANGAGQLGDGTKTVQYVPVKVSGLSDVVAIAAGFNHTVALRTDGTIWAWGNNYYGQLGDGTTTERLTPVPVVGF